MSETVHLGLPFLSPAQAQKHVTHNAALSELDALVQLAVLDRDLATPPGSPAQGARYIVAASPTGAWTGKAAKVAAFVDGGWTFHTPREGWRAWVMDENRLLVHDGAAWVDYQPSISSLQNLTMLGVNTTADVTNKLAVRSNAVLFASLDAGDGGNGDVQFKVDKEAAGDTASLIFQTNASGRAEVGLTGDDDFHFKVSANGSAFIDAIVIDKDDGQARFLAGSAAAPSVAVRNADYGLFSPTATSIGFTIAGAEAARLTATGLKLGAPGDPGFLLHLQRTGASTLAYMVEGEANTFATLRRASSDSSAPATVFSKRRNTLASPQAVAQNDILGTVNFTGYGGTADQNGGIVRMTAIAATPSDANMEARLIGLLSPASSVVPTEIFRFDHATGFSMFGANPVVDQNRLIVNRSSTLAGLAGGAAAKQQYASDLGGGASLLLHDGTRWKRFRNGGCQTISTDANVTVGALTDAVNIRHTGTLTADRTMTLSTTDASPGEEKLVTRTGAGAFSLSVGGLKNLATNTWCKAVYDGSAWYLAAYGAL